MKAWRTVMPRLAVATLMMSLAGSACAQGLSMVRWTVAGGGDVYTASADGRWTLSGTLGDWDASAPQHGGGWTLTGGFWAGAAIEPEGTSIFRDGFESG